MKITIHENEDAIIAETIEKMDSIIEAATAEARSKQIINVIFFKANNGNEISLAVGGDETVLNFVYGDLEPPYFVSQGTTKEEKPVLTCHVTLEHHTEYPRSWVIPAAEGLNAVHGFFNTGELPKSITWTQT